MAKRASKKKAVKTKAGTAQPKIFKGLAGVVADTTSISKVMPETNSLLTGAMRSRIWQHNAVLKK